MSKKRESKLTGLFATICGMWSGSGKSSKKPTGGFSPELLLLEDRITPTVFQNITPPFNISTAVSNESENTMAVNPTNPLNALAMGTNFSELFNQGLAVIYVTIDGGTNWQPVNIPNPAGLFYRGDPVVTFSRDGRAVFTAISSSTIGSGVTGIQTALSTDGGFSWTAGAMSRLGGEDKQDIIAGPDVNDPTVDRFYGTWHQGNTIFAASSVDGLTWTPRVRVSDQTAGAINSHMAVSATGDLYVSWIRFANGQVLFDKSSDGGQTWGTDVVVDTVNPTIGYGITPQPSRGILQPTAIDVDDSGGPFHGRIYVEVMDSANADDDTDIFVRASDDNGVTWNALGGRVRVNDDATANSQWNPWLRVDPYTGFVAMGWYDARLDLGAGGIGDTDGIANSEAHFFVSVSDNGGVNWAPNQRVSSGPSDGPSGAPGFEFGEYTAVDIMAGRMYALWSDNSPGFPGLPDPPNFDIAGAVLLVRDSGALNDAPVNTVPGPQIINEDSGLIFSERLGTRVSVYDVDALDAPLRVTLTASVGTLSLPTTAGLSFLVGTGTNDATMTFTGDQTAINAAIRGLSFASPLEFNGNATVTITTEDLGSTGTGSVGVDVDVIDITVLQVNDPPTNILPAAQFVNEDTPLTLSIVGGNGLAVADPDAGNASIQMTLTVTNGTISINPAFLGQLTFLAGDGTDDIAMQFRGTITDINNALSNIVYTPTPDFFGTALLTISTNDLGNTGGPAATTTSTLTINVNPVNDAPINVIPATVLTINEDQQRFLTGLQVIDSDSGASNIQVTLRAVNGRFNVAPGVPGGVSGTQIVGNGTSEVTFNATLSQINATLASATGVLYTPNANFAGNEVITMFSDDRGNFGAGGAMTDSDDISVTILPVNDAPTNTKPTGVVEANEDTPTPITGLAVSDVDAGVAPISVRFTANIGKITLSTTVGGGLTGGQITGNGTSNVIATGTIAQINATLAALNGVLYTSALNYNGADTVTMTSNDAGNTGAGGALTDVDPINILVNSVNDAPVNVIPPGPFAMNGDQQVFISGVQIIDVDAGSNNITVKLSVANGRLTVDPDVFGGVPVGQIAFNGTPGVLLTGTLDQINATLADANGLLYQGNASSFGDTLTIETNDGGNSGDGGTLVDIDTLAIADAPIETNQDVFGDNLNNTILIRPYGTSTTDVIVQVDGITRGRYSPTANNPVRVFGGEGNDFIQVQTTGLIGFFINGGGGADTIEGGVGSDTIFGEAGNDLIFGRGENDFLFGGEGNDNIDGGLGNDGIDGNAGNDQIFGSEGDDFLFGSDGNDSIDGGSGADGIDGGLGADYANGGDGADYISGSDGIDSLDGAAGNDSIDGGEGADQLFGSAGDDIIFGLGGQDRIDGGDGNDGIDAGADNDIVFGGTGNDLIFGGDGADQIDAGAGDDSVDGNAGNDLIFLGAGNDLGFGSDGNDSMQGDAGDDTLGGGTGNDLMYGNAGNDIMYGEAGNDSLDGGTGVNFNDGGSGINFIK